MRSRLSKFHFFGLLVLVLATAVGAEPVVPKGKALNPAPTGFLPVDEAFVLTLSQEGEQVLIRWLVAPGYYLYKHRLSFLGIDVATVPEGITREDEIFGEVEVFYDELLISGYLGSKASNVENFITVRYQGCADAGLCYPPQTRQLHLDNL